MNTYGAQETNGLEGAPGPWTRWARDGHLWTDWKDKNLKRVLRLRLVSDPGFPAWDVSYCYGELKDGKIARIELPFSQLPKGRINIEILKYAIKDGVFAKGLGVFDAISTLC